MGYADEHLARSDLRRVRQFRLCLHLDPGRRLFIRAVRRPRRIKKAYRSEMTVTAVDNVIGNETWILFKDRYQLFFGTLREFIH